MAAKPNVYASQIDGVHEWIVAAPNQAAALAAWGVNQNLFAQGQARIETEPAAVRAALKAAGAPLWRLTGSSGAFTPVAPRGDVAGWTAAAKAIGARAARSKPKPSRAPLEKVQRALDRQAEDLERRPEEERKQLAQAVGKRRRALEV
ncbi:MAG TPA: hypothetical protein VII73_04340 [Caulobacteraceae bacterium]